MHRPDYYPFETTFGLRLATVTILIDERLYFKHKTCTKKLISIDLKHKSKFFPFEVSVFTFLCKHIQKT